MYENLCLPLSISEQVFPSSRFDFWFFSTSYKLSHVLSTYSSSLPCIFCKCFQNFTGMGYKWYGPVVIAYYWWSSSFLRIGVYIHTTYCKIRNCFSLMCSFYGLHSGSTSFVTQRMVDIWISPPATVAEAPSLNSFKNRIDLFMSDYMYSCHDVILERCWWYIFEKNICKCRICLFH